MRWKAPESAPLVRDALRAAERTDLLPRFEHFVRQARSKKRTGKGRTAPRRGLDLDTCG